MIFYFRSLIDVCLSAQKKGKTWKKYVRAATATLLAETIKFYFAIV